MVKKSTPPTTTPTQPDSPTPPTSIQEESGFQPEVGFTEEQLRAVKRMIEEQKSESNSNDAVSVYGKKDFRVLTNVKVSIFNGKFVIGFVNLQNNKYDARPKYSVMKTDIVRKLNNQPFLTLMLSNDGEDIEQLEVALIDYVDNRTRMSLPIIKQETEEVITDHGLLGHPGGNFASGVNKEGWALSRQSIKAESKEVIRTFYVQPEGFKKAVQLREEFLA